MAVTQVSKIQVRRGRKGDLPKSLSEGEIAMTTDTGEVLIGAPNFEMIEFRDSEGIFPYKNIRILTEFDVVHTMHDHTVTLQPLMRVDSPVSILGNHRTHEFRPNLISDTNNIVRPSPREVEFVSTANPGLRPGDLRGQTAARVEFLDSNDDWIRFEVSSISVLHKPGQFEDSFIILDLDEAANSLNVTSATRIRVTFLDTDILAEFPLATSSNFVMNYSLKNKFVHPDTNLRVSRTGTLHIAADEYSVAIVDTGVTLNNNIDTDPNVDNSMRVNMSGHTENRGTADAPSYWVVLTCTNEGYHPVSITYCGSRWAHSLTDEE